MFVIRDVQWSVCNLVETITDRDKCTESLNSFISVEVQGFSEHCGNIQLICFKENTTIENNDEKIIQRKGISNNGS